MIGHIFTTSGATTLALAPSADRPDEYIVLAAVENGYAVANVLTSQMPTPDHWLRAAYFDRCDGDDLDEAVEQFARETGSDNLVTLRAHVEHAQQIAEHRAHLAAEDA